MQAAEYPNLGHVVIRGKADDARFVDAAQAALGGNLPAASGAIAVCRAGVVLWQSPDEWWLACTRGERDATVAELRDALKDCFAQVVDNSGGFTALHLRGRDWSRVLRHLSPFDIDGLGVRTSASTVIGKTAYTIVRTGEDAVTLLFRRSFAQYVWDLVERASRPYGLAAVEAQAVPDGLFSELLLERVTAPAPAAARAAGPA
ncbi:sarcosine oxidase subunit gamma [Ramlibacter sp.]|uniref:sarcosine oxidase subunit gamma n=1 Tax=Ramlibacter sp. TaxID=1917967 RepID=UPI003D10492C